MTERSFVSICIPNYNHAVFLQQRLDSVFQQTYRDFEVILLDDASTDGSIEILKKYQNHPKVSHLVINETNSGSPFKQWQKGIAMAQGAYVWIAESDDFSEPVFLETLMHSFRNDVGLIYCQTKDVNEKGEVLLDRIDFTKDIQPNYWQDDFEMEGTDFIKKGLLIKNVIPNASAVVFKKSLIRPSFFSNSLLQMKMCGDWFFWLQLTKNTNVKFVNRHLNYFRNHTSISRIHKEPETKKRRLIEEAVLRRFADEQYGLSLNEMNAVLYKKWFRLHDKWGLIRTHFYQVRQPSTSIIEFIFKFIQLKLMNHKK